MKKNILLLLLVLEASLLLAQNNSGSKKNRPQTPQPPFEYNVDSVEYDNADKTVHLGATFTYPKTGKSFVTAVMITGSGLQDRDETIFNHKPFAVIADYLTKNGFAVLRVDDRNMGKSKGDIKNATSLSFADDVMTSINYLLQRTEVNKNKIGVIGHSEGGFIAPIIYTKWPKLAFIISLAGTGVPGFEISLKQLTEPLKGLIDSAAISAYYTLEKVALQNILDNADKPDSVTLTAERKSYTYWKASQPDTILNTLHLKNVTTDMFATQLSFQLKPWVKYFLATDPAQFWQKVKCPVLALNGQKDIQVNAAQNILAISSSLQKAGDKNVTTKIFPGLNHLFQHCTKCTIAEYNELEETFSPEVLKVMGDWLEKNFR